jgi:hypothetical protein
MDNSKFLKEIKFTGHAKESKIECTIDTTLQFGTTMPLSFQSNF